MCQYVIGEFVKISSSVNVSEAESSGRISLTNYLHEHCTMDNIAPCNFIHNQYYIPKMLTYLAN